MFLTFNPVKLLKKYSIFRQYSIKILKLQNFIKKKYYGDKPRLALILIVSIQ